VTVRGTHGDVTNPGPPEDGEGNIHSRIAHSPDLAVEISKSVHILAVDSKDQVVRLQAGLFCGTVGRNPGNEDPAAASSELIPSQGLGGFRNDPWAIRSSRIGEGDRWGRTHCRGSIRTPARQSA